MQGPIRGTLFNQEIHQSGATLNLNQFDNLAIEAEMAFQTGAGGEITSVFPVIELHNFVFRAPKKSLSELIANNGLNKGIILPDQNWKGDIQPTKEGLTMGEAIASINKHTGGDAVIVTDVGQHQMVACRYAEFIRSKSNVTSGGLGTAQSV